MGKVMPFDAERTLLLIDADQRMHRSATIVGTRAGWRVQAVTNVEAAVQILGADADVTALLLCGGKEEAIPALLAARADLPLIVAGEGSGSVAALRAGASDFLASPVAPDRLLAALTIAGDRRRRRGELRPVAEKNAKPLAFDEMVGSTPAFRAVLAVAAKAARSRISVLIEGEQGTGKETVALAIHNAGPRAQRPFVGLDCSAVPANHLDALLFGYEKGAFPGAFERRTGKLQEADGGALFLENPGALPPEAQARLLAFIESGEVHRLGGRGFKTADVRIIASSASPLLDRVRVGEFREDLYYRLAGVHLQVPPLRDRRGDIPGLARHLLARIAEQPGMRALGITDDALSVLMSYGWPGNVGQLHNALFRAALSCEGNALSAADLPRVALESTFSNRADDYVATPLSVPASAALADAPGITLYQADGNLRTLEEIEADVIRLAIGRYHGRMTEVARRLGIGRSTLYRKLAELGISDAA